MKNKIFSLMAVVMFATSLMSATSDETFDMKTGCSTVYTVCDTAFPNNFELFETCMVNNGCAELTMSPD